MDLSTPQLITNLILWYVVFLFSTTMHEAMHAYAATKWGDNTALQSGLVTFNPIPHMKRSPIGMIVAPLVVFFLNNGNFMIGWASTPFNPYWAARYPKRSLIMSMAGPLSHLGIVIVSGLLFALVAGLGFFETGSRLAWPIYQLLSVIFNLNLLLFFFNILPFPPLDGSEFYYLFIKREEDRLKWRMTANSYWIVGIVLSWYVLEKAYPYVYAIATIMRSAVALFIHSLLG